MNMATNVTSEEAAYRFISPLQRHIEQEFATGSR
jgi:hypothetical protein